MKKAYRCAALVAAVLFTMGAVPRHVLTGAYFGGYNGTHKVSPQRAASVLSLAEVAPADSGVMSALGVKTMLYSDPSREQPGDPMWPRDENVFAHDCSGAHVSTGSHYAGQVLTDPSSPALRDMWRTYVARREEGGHYDFIFDDDAVGAKYLANPPCGYSFDRWLEAHKALVRALDAKVIYNGLNDFNGHGTAAEMRLNSVAAGGMMEECYAQLAPDHRVGGWQWWATEETELRMAQQHKYFICYGRDLSPADQSYDSRLYTFASFLLTYDINTSVLWEYYKTPSDLQVMPESRIVALHPVKSIRRVADLRSKEGVFVRAYRDCFIDGERVGACAAAVNPDDDAHPLHLSGFRRTLQLQGAGILDGGRVRITGQRPPASLGPRGAVIAFN
jgi:hypothetical protein